MRSSLRFKLVSVLTGTMLLLAAGPVLAVTQADLRSVESKLNATKAKIREGDASKAALGQEIKTADDQLGALENQLRQLNDQAVKAREAKNTITAELDRLRRELAKTQSKLDKATARLKRLTISLNRRAGSAYKNGEVSFLEVLLDANDFSDFIGRFRFLQTIVNLDAKLVRNIKTTKAGIEKARATIDKDRAATQAREDALAIEVKRLDGLASAQLAKNNEVKASINSKQQLIAKIDSEKDSLLTEEAQEDASAKRILAQLAQQGGAAPVVGTPSTSGFIWPVSGPITSGFRPRWGRMHTGIDIGVSYGTPVAAAKAGRVAITDWYGGYGNLIVIDHGGGVTTWYGHNSKFTVGVGQQVSQGQIIAKAGSTGNSTGPHVHFEVRINGNPQNPINYLP
ncbi:MAG: peptidoglycan DD-metalloendopeptidase family protein [Actinomycetota bacterium]|nr:peptidoglycan DD-metalloendopeptidase family protein [Actinomycetota bacterium]